MRWNLVSTSPLSQSKIFDPLIGKHAVEKKAMRAFFCCKLNWMRRGHEKL